MHRPHESLPIRQTAEGVRYRPIYVPDPARPMRVVFFASGGPGNLQTALDVEDAWPGRVHVGLVVTDRPGIPSVALAEQRGIPCLVRDFESICGAWSAARADPARLSRYEACRERFHDAVLEAILAFEEDRGRRFDLAVLAYRRIIQGRLLAYFEDRMINQHPADLAVLDPDGRRPYIGIGGLERSIRSGEASTRTSTIVVRRGVDDGEILCRGPRVKVDDPQAAVASHEARQKVASDRPSLRFALTAIAEGRLGLACDELHPDGRRVVVCDGIAQPYGGVEVEGP
jgi:phosphoribosylglycinamide formyltransferase 1